MARFIIFGSGLAGLAAAYKLSENNYHEVFVIEKEDQVGGLAKSILLDNNTFDIGPHRFHSNNKTIIDFFKNIVGVDYLVQTKYSEIYFNQKYLKYPITAFDILSKLSFKDSILSFMYFFKERLQGLFKDKPERNLEEWTINRFGKKLYEIYFEPYTEKVWGIHSRDISVDWAHDRIPLMNFWQLIKSTLLYTLGGQPSTSHHHSPYLSKFYYPKYGTGAFIKNLENKLRSRGVKFIMSSEVIRFNLDSKTNLKSVLIKDSTNEEEISGDFFLSTIPITKQFELLNFQDTEFKQKIEFRGILFIFMLLSINHLTKNHWIYYPQKDIIFNRITEMKNFSPFLNTSDKTGIILEIAFGKGDEIDNMPQNLILGQATSDLEKIKFIKRDQIKETMIYKSYSGYPIYKLSYLKTLTWYKKELSKIKNLRSAGRQATFKYLNMDQVIMQGFEKAEELLKITQEK